MHIIRVLGHAGWTTTLVLAGGLALAGCRAGDPVVICAMQNPHTGQVVKLYKEIWYKVPADYDEKQHIAQWKAQNIKAGYTVQVREDAHTCDCSGN